MFSKTRAISQTLFQLIARIFSTFANFVLILLIARKFGSGGLGSYNKVFSFIAFFTLFIDFGLNSIFIKLEDYKKQFITLIVLRLFLSLLLIFVLQFILFFLPYDELTMSGFSFLEKIYIEIISLSFILYSFIYSLMAIVQKERVYERAIIPQVLFSIFLLIIGFIGYESNNFLLFFIATLIGLLVQIISLALSLKSIFKKDKGYRLLIKNIFIEVKELLVRSIPIGATFFLNSLYVRVDVFILALLKPNSDVGIYTLAYKFFEFPLIFSFFLMNTMYPQMVEANKDGKGTLLSFIKKRYLYILLFSLIITILAYISAPLIGLIKKDFLESINTFRVLLLSYPIFFTSNILLWMIITVNKEKILPFIYGLSLVVNAGLNWIFIPKYSYISASWITIFTEMIVLVSFGLYIIRVYNKRT